MAAKLCAASSHTHTNRTNRQQRSHEYFATFVVVSDALFIFIISTYSYVYNGLDIINRYMLPVSCIAMGNVSIQGAIQEISRFLENFDMDQIHMHAYPYMLHCCQTATGNGRSHTCARRLWISRFLATCNACIGRLRCIRT